MPNERMLWTTTIDWSDVQALLADPLNFLANLPAPPPVLTTDRRNITIEFEYHLNENINHKKILLQGVTGIDIITARIFELPDSPPPPNVVFDPSMKQGIRLNRGRKAAFVHYHPTAATVPDLALGFLQNPGSIATALQAQIAQFEVIVEDPDPTVRHAATATIQSSDLQMLRYETLPASSQGQIRSRASSTCDPCCQVQGAVINPSDPGAAYNLSLDWAIYSCYSAAATFRKKRGSR